MLRRFVGLKHLVGIRTFDRVQHELVVSNKKQTNTRFIKCFFSVKSINRCEHVTVSVTTARSPSFSCKVHSATPDCEWETTGEASSGGQHLTETHSSCITGLMANHLKEKHGWNWYNLWRKRFGTLKQPSMRCYKSENTWGNSQNKNKKISTVSISCEHAYCSTKVWICTVYHFVKAALA